jgi:hypothetical protein
MSDIKPDLLTKLAEKCASEHYGYGFDRQDLDEALLAFGRELLSEMAKEAEAKASQWKSHCDNLQGILPASAKLNRVRGDELNDFATWMRKIGEEK